MHLNSIQRKVRIILLAIGCTGGQHRSVTIANYLYDVYKERYNCYLDHRDQKEWLTHEEA